ncbi:MAG: hypothetical protein AB8F65_01250 [Woeseiaceae bacterium]
MKYLAISLLLLIAAPGYSEISKTELPADSHWYLHVDLDAMRTSGSGRQLYQWVNEEIFDDVRDDTGFDPDTEVSDITLYSAGTDHATLVVRGDLRQASQDKLIAVLAAKSEFEVEKQGRFNFYRIKDIDIENDELQIDQDELFVSFDRKNTWIFSTQMNSLLSVLSGKQAMAKQDGDALLVLSAKKPSVQAGVDSEGFGERFSSGVLRNARQLAFRLSDDSGNADIELRITARDAQTSNALASIVRGLIGLQALSSDVDNEIGPLLNALKVESDAEGLSLRLNIAPESIVEILN